MTLRESIARIICVADGVDPDGIGFGCGVSMPEGEEYPLWKARLKQADALIEDADLLVEYDP